MGAEMIARLLAWIRSELRLLGLETWADGAYEGPAPFTAADPRCANTIARLAQAREELRRTKRGLLDKREVPDDFLAHTDVRATIRAANPPVRLLGRRAK